MHNTKQVGAVDVDKLRPSAPHGRNGLSQGSSTRGVAPRRALLLGVGTCLYTIGAWLDALTADSRQAPRAALICALFVAGTWVLIRATGHHAPLPPSSPHSRRYRLAASGVLAGVMLCATVTVLLTAAIMVTKTNDTHIYDSDATAFNHYNAELVLRGQNPYTADGDFWDAVRQFPNAGATPLRRGRYAGSVYGPDLVQLVRDVKSELAHPASRGPEFSGASLHSYPALAFLVYVPGVWAGLTTTLLTTLLFTALFLTACGWGAPRRTRVWVWAVLLANTLLVFWALRGSFEVIALLPVVLAWRTLDRRWLSPVLFGLGCAVKQLVWPLAPLYAVIVWRRYGARAAVARLAIAAVAFLLPNLPYIAQNPGAWASSMLLPVSLPIFPSGIGLVGLAKYGLLPLLPPAVYSLLELAGVVALTVWFARAKVMPRPEVALVVGLLPFAVSWHSAFAYFIAIPSLAACACLPLLAADVRGDDTQTAHTENEELSAAIPGV